MISPIDFAMMPGGIRQALLGEAAKQLGDGRVIFLLSDKLKKISRTNLAIQPNYDK